LCSLATGAAALVMTACGSQLASPSGATQPARPSQAAGGIPTSGGGTGRTGLCSNVPAVTRLAVSRVTVLPQDHLRFVFPAAVTVTSPAEARAVAKALCTLPAMPSGVMSCPMDQGVSYRLDFAAGRTSFPLITAAASGCNAVAGAGAVRRAGSASFWTVLGQAMGIKHAASSVLRGPARLDEPRPLVGSLNDGGVARDWLPGW
jgi:hypothetical protein